MAKRFLWHSQRMRVLPPVRGWFVDCGQSGRGERGGREATSWNICQCKHVMCLPKLWATANRRLKCDSCNSWVPQRNQIGCANDRADLCGSTTDTDTSADKDTHTDTDTGADTDTDTDSDTFTFKFTFT